MDIVQVYLPSGSGVGVRGGVGVDVGVAVGLGVTVVVLEGSGVGVEPSSVSLREPPCPRRTGIESLCDSINPEGEGFGVELVSVVVSPGVIVGLGEGVGVGDSPWFFSP